VIENSPYGWTADLYAHATRDAGVPATRVMVTPFPQSDDQPDYADIICTLAVADDIVAALDAQNYRYKIRYGTSGSALRVRIRVFRNQQG